MLRKLLVGFIAMFLLPALLVAQDGKLRGKVTDKESGEPLIGANVLVEGTSLGASTDINGEYIVLSVPAGTYSAKVSYVGYSPVTISNIRLSSNQTTTQDFALSSTAIQVSAVEIIAERPLIQRNTTSTVRVATQENITNLPMRGLQNIVALEAGVVQKDGILYIRGGRNGEVAYFVDGANATNPFTNQQGVNVIQEAIEELQVQTGGYTADLGGANSGLVRTTTRTGGSAMKFTVDYQTDDFAKPGKQFLGTSAFGYRNAVVTLGGPLGSNDIRFFVAGQHNFNRSRQRIFLEPFKFENMVTDGLGSRPAGTPLPGPVEFQRNYLYNAWSESNQIQGNLLFNLESFKVKVAGSYEKSSSIGGGTWPGALQFIFNQKKNTLSDVERMLLNARLTHILTPSAFYEVSVWYQGLSNKRYDQDFKDASFEDLLKYPDSLANAALGYTGWTGRYSGPPTYSTIFAFNFADPSAPNNSYSKGKQTSFGASVDFTSQVNSRWELKLGGRLENWVIRSYGFGSIAGFLNYMDSNGDGVFDRTHADAYEERVRVMRAGAIGAVGYDYKGKETDDVLDGPGKPVFASAYAQNKFEYGDLIVNLGARYEYFNPKGKSVPQTINPKTGLIDWDDPELNSALGVVNEQNLQETKPFNLLLPRISFSFPVTDRTVFYALYGKYAQMPALNQLYINNITLSDLVNPTTRTPYNLGGSPVGFLMKPERLTQYEMGLRQSLTDNFAVTITGFYKDTKDQLALRRIFNSANIPLFVAYTNEDFGTQKGLEVTLELRRTSRLQAKVNYTLSDARGTGSQSRSSQNAVTDELLARFPNFVTPLDFNQTHRGSATVDYRWDKGDGGAILEGMGVNFLLTFNSGHNYTKIAEPQNLGQSSPWQIGVRALADSRSRNPVEPINTSSTPWVFTVDMTWSKVFFMGGGSLELYARVLNLFNSKSVINVYPTTGTPDDDGWLKSPFAAAYKAIPLYEEFYRTINLQNRHHYLSLGNGGGLGGQVGSDLYGSPREIRVGVKLDY